MKGNCVYVIENIDIYGVWNILFYVMLLVYVLN